MTVVTILGCVACVLAVIALVPAWREHPVLAVAVLLLAICAILMGGGVLVR